MTELRLANLVFGNACTVRSRSRAPTLISQLCGVRTTRKTDYVLCQRMCKASLRYSGAI